MSLTQKYSEKDKDKLTGKHFGELFLAEEVPGWYGRQGFVVEEARGKSQPYLADTLHYFFISTCTPLSLGPWGCAY